MQDFLRALGLDQYATLFAEHEVDLATLRILTDGDLKELGLPFGPRKRLLAAVADLARAEGAPPAAAPAPPAAEPNGAGPGAPSGDGERRQLTVLFCDLVGFTELASRLDPEVLRTVIRRYEDTCAACITRYEGYVFQRLGDGIVAFFGFPLAHEGEAERAMHAGLEIVDALARERVGEAGRLLQVRIGIATGVVVVSAAERSAVGETMNLAARLQGLAEPGSIVVSERVHRIAGGAFAYEDLGLQSVKGIARPTRAWRVLGVGRAASRFEAATQEGVTPLVGREEELALLADRWRRAREGEGQVVLVSGEAGVGKSRLVSALRDRLGEVTALPFQCSPYHLNSAFHPVIDYLERSLAFARDEPPESRLDRLEALVVGRLGRPREEVHFLAGLLSLPAGDRYGAAPLSPRRQKQETIRALVELVGALAHAGPTVLLFEDAHWADPSTLELLDLLVERARALPLLALVTHRPEFLSRWSAYPHVRAVDLSRLGREESRAIVTRLSGGKALPPELVEELVGKADGVPLFVEELTKSVLESGDLVDAGDRWAYAGTRADVAVPATLRDSLMARLDHVNVVKEIAQVGAAIGREFSFELLAAVSALSPPVLVEGLERLTESGLAFRRGRGEEATYTFKHALVQDAAYDSLLKSRRQELHAAIARALEGRFPDTADGQPELLARHYTAAGLDERAAAYWTRAGDAALRRTALPEAISHLRAGLARAAALPAGPARDRSEVELRRMLGVALMAHRGWGAAEVPSVLEPAWRLTESLAHRESYLPVLHCLWVHNMCIARLATSVEWAERMLEYAARVGDESLTVNGHRAAMASYFWMGRLREALAHGDRVRALYDGERHRHIATLTASDPLTADGIYRAHFIWMLGYPDQARAVSEATAEHARRRGHPFDLAFALTLGAQAFEYCGDAERLLRCADEAERVGRHYGVPLMSEVMAEITRAEAWLLDGRVDDGVVQLRASVDRLSATGHRVWIAYHLTRIAEVLGRRGEVDAGLALARESLTRADCLEDRVHRPEMLRLYGVLLGAAGRAAEAEATLRDAIALAREQHARSWELRAATTLARRLADRGERDAARALLAPVHGWFTEGFDTADLRASRALLDALAP